MIASQKEKVMNKTGFLYDERLLNHQTGSYHPESPARLQAIYNGLKEADLLSHLTLIPARPAEMKWLEAIHDKTYIDRFRELCLAGADTFDYPDNQMCPDTYDTALLAVGGIIETVRLVMAGDIDNAFCAVRPPGHHAECNKAMGFCYFANVAIAARYAIQEWGLRRIGIIDFDVHHGNGTQHILEEEADVFYYSIHEHPSFSFPGTGRIFEKGTGTGKGFTRNFPVLPGQGDEEYKKIIETDLIPTFDQFKPEMVLVSAGFDAHADDVMSALN
jgi:acetoin utilization deacetylase AcuC-like enzyme